MQHSDLHLVDGLTVFSLTHAQAQTTVELVCTTVASTSWQTHQNTAQAQVPMGNLLRIDSKEFRDVIENVGFPGGTNYWIGLSDQTTEGDFVWVDDDQTVVWRGASTFESGAPLDGCFTNWVTSEPEDNTANNCVFYEVPTGVWADGGCGSQLRALFQFPAGFTDQGEFQDCQSVTRPTSDCDGAAAGSTDLVVCRNDVLKSWQQHRNDAQAVDSQAELLRVDSQAFRDIVNALTGFPDNSYWIGLNDQTTEGDFVWVDDDQTVVWRGASTGEGGAPLNGCYTNWAASEPEDNTANNCAFAQDNWAWADGGCGSSFPALVQFPQGTTPGAAYGNCVDVTRPPSDCLSLSRGGDSGDPHFLRWAQQHHDSFHGECDLLLVSNRQKAIHVTIRTRIRKWYSYIYKTAIAIGEHVVELGKAYLAIDGINLTLDTASNTSFPMELQDAIHGTVTIDATGKEEFRIGWGTSPSFISVTIIGVFVNVDVQNREGDSFVESVGMMGKYGTGEMLDRKGQPMDPNDMNAFGMEWQVKPDRGDPLLFSQPEGPQWPESQCVLPQWVDLKRKKGRRKLRGSNNDKLIEEAKSACSDVIDYDLCVEDILATGEIGLAKTFVTK